MAKNRQCSWTGKTRRELRLASRINAQEWDGLFALANETGTPVKRIVRDAVREYIARHRQQENRSEVCITVRSNDSSGGIIGKLVQLLDGHGKPTAGRHLPG